MNKISSQLIKIAKQVISSYDDYDIAIQVKQQIVDLIYKNNISQQSIKKLIESYEDVNIDFIIDELDEFAKFNQQHETSVNKVCKILEKM